MESAIFLDAGYEHNGVGNPSRHKKYSGVSGLSRRKIKARRSLRSF
jgi:hypothetical protein